MQSQPSYESPTPPTAHLPERHIPFVSPLIAPGDTSPSSVDYREPIIHPPTHRMPLVTVAQRPDGAERNPPASSSPAPLEAPIQQAQIENPPHTSTPPADEATHIVQIDAPTRRTPTEHAIGRLRATTSLEERHPGWPKVTFNLYLTAHANAADIRDLSSTLQGDDSRGIRPADIYCTEAPIDLPPQGLDAIRHLSEEEFERRITELQEQTNDTFSAEEVRALRQSSVTVEASFDAPKDLYTLVESLLITYGCLDPRKTLDETLDVINTRAMQNAGIIKTRDKLALGPSYDHDSQSVTAGNFERVLEDCFRKYPELLNQDQVRVVATYGAYHTAHIHRARAAGVTTNAIFESSITDSGLNRYNYDPHVALIRAYQYGKTPSRQLLVASFNSLATKSALARRLPQTDANTPSSAVSWHTSAVATALGEAGAETIHQTLLSGGDLPTTIDAILAPSGMRLATSIPDLWDMINERQTAYQERLRTLAHNIGVSACTFAPGHRIS